MSHRVARWRKEYRKPYHGGVFAKRVSGANLTKVLAAAVHGCSRAQSIHQQLVRGEKVPQ
ncbi:hypothetical protein E2C01_092400 [Portunus trituberculatus]|uniref:Uncharacterized protein n=1 Tax=Portunus trituberculatus TaxID=210409 RepID=A0A5B7JVD0_PORTR|nr:hypothetical protein [Portunus trituberculatus]